MGGRRVWGAWIVFLVAAAPSGVDLLRVDRPVDADSSYHRPVSNAASFPEMFTRAPLEYLSAAPADSLCLLPGIGPVLAARIVDARSGQGPFSSWDNLRRRVAGIGEKSAARLRQAADPAEYPIARWVNEAEKTSE